MAAFITKRVITEVHPIDIGEGEMSIGQRIDEVVYSALKEGRVLAEISFQLEESEWHKLEAYYTKRPSSAVEPARKVTRAQ